MATIFFAFANWLINFDTKLNFYYSIIMTDLAKTIFICNMESIPEKNNLGRYFAQVENKTPTSFTFYKFPLEAKKYFHGEQDPGTLPCEQQGRVL